jgi:exoribonuclease R
LGKVGDNETEMAAAVYDRGLVMGFPEEVEKAAQDLKKRSKKMIENERPNRRDLTH